MMADTYVLCGYMGWIRKIGKKTIWLSASPTGTTLRSIPREAIREVTYDDGTTTTVFYTRKILAIELHRHVAAMNGMELI
jgi:hypothetical protein